METKLIQQKRGTCSIFGTHDYYNTRFLYSASHLPFFKAELTTFRTTALLSKIPEIKNALNVLKHLNGKTEDVVTQFELSDCVFVKASITHTDRVMLWLGANVMVEYAMEEAIALLSKNYTSAEINLRELNVDVEFLKDQITVTEVNIARIHNYKVQLNQALKNKK